jgi:di/tricarboxylate transporter
MHVAQFIADRLQQLSTQVEAPRVLLALFGEFYLFLAKFISNEAAQQDI